ncbi:hypothetical protein BGZ49_000703 [Haplosporangium sp. Z 27]|nr:hypothetical protein BGZ49_000703 [Haplosporangium sp. Z 27]
MYRAQATWTTSKYFAMNFEMIYRFKKVDLMERRATRSSNVITSSESTTVASETVSKVSRARGQTRGRSRGGNRGRGRGSTPTKAPHGRESDLEAQDDQDQKQEQEDEEMHSHDPIDQADESSEPQPHETLSTQTDAVSQEESFVDSQMLDQPTNQKAPSDADTTEESILPLITPATQSKLEESDPIENNTSLLTTSPANATSKLAPLQESAPNTSIFFREDLYNQVSAGGTGRLQELFSLKKRRADVHEESIPESDSEEAIDEAGEKLPRKKKQRVSKSVGAHNQGTSDDNNNNAAHSQISSLSSPNTATASSSSDLLQAPPHAKFDISDLVASVTSYVPEIASALHSFQIQKPATDQQKLSSQQQQQQQQHQPSIIQMKATDVQFHHPCIDGHSRRSTLTKEEHRRYLMYDAIARGLHKNEIQPQLSPEDRALWATLQEKVDQERHNVRQWQAELVRSRINICFIPAIRDAMEAKFIKARTRVQEEYPQHYEFVHSIGLRLPGVPTTKSSAKEPTLNRKKPDAIPSVVHGSHTETQSTEPNPRGLLKRTGRICPVSLAKPTWPTDDDGVPYEKAIDISDKYWSIPIAPQNPTKPLLSNTGSRLSEQEYRRTHLPGKSPALSVAKDPTVRQFVKEQNVQIAFSASSLVELVKTLPSLASEWEIPVRVVLEEDLEGVLQKRIYVDKPLIRKKMSALEMTQSFYDCVIKKLSLVGTSSIDASSLASTSQAASSDPHKDSSKSEVTSSSLTKEPNIGDLPVTSSTLPKESSEKPDTEPVDKVQEVISKGNEASHTTQHVNGVEEEEGILGSQSVLPTSEECNGGLEYSLWTFGETRILIRSRIHGYLNNSEPYRQVVIRSILDYAPDIGLNEASKATMAGWWMETWIRDDRLVALGRIDVSKNQFVRYPDPQNPLGGVFSDLPVISILDASAIRAQDRGDWIKPNMRLIHYIIGKLLLLGPGQYILGHKRNDINANIYKAVQETEESVSNGKKKVSAKGQYDLHAAHKSSPQPLSTEGDAGLLDDDLQLQWVGTPDQVPGTFPYGEPERTGNRKGRGRGKRPNK